MAVRVTVTLTIAIAIARTDNYNLHIWTTHRCMHPYLGQGCRPNRFYLARMAALDVPCCDSGSAHTIRRLDCTSWLEFLDIGLLYGF